MTFARMPVTSSTKKPVQEYQLNEPLQPVNCYIYHEHIDCIVVDLFYQNQCL